MKGMETFDELNEMGLGIERLDGEPRAEFADRLRDEIDFEISLLEQAKQHIDTIDLDDDEHAAGPRQLHPGTPSIH